MTALPSVVRVLLFSYFGIASYFENLKKADSDELSAKVTVARKQTSEPPDGVFQFWIHCIAVVSYRRLVLPVVVMSTGSVPAPVLQVMLCCWKDLIAARVVCSTLPAKTLNLSGMVEPPFAVFQTVPEFGLGGDPGAATKTEFGTPTGA